MFGRALVIAYWTFHFAFAAAFVSFEAFRKAKPVASGPLFVWSTYTGAANGYAFFAPVVPDARRVRVTALCNGQRVSVNTPLNGVESGIRLMTITSLLLQERTEKAAAASWAAYAFGRVQCAEAVLVQVDRYVVPTMAAYQSGARPRWQVTGVHAFAEGRRSR